MSSQDELKERFLKFREKKYAMPLGLALALLIGLLLIPFLGALCFGSLLIALVGFYVPYYFGLKDRRKLAVWGVVFVVVLGIAYTMMAGVGSINSMEGLQLESSDGLLVNGTVEPYRGEASTEHTFFVTVTDSSSGNYSVNVVITDQYSLQEVGNHTMSSAGAVAGGERFVSSAITLDSQSVYSYHFTTNATGAWVDTFESYGPVHQSDVEMFIHYLPLFTMALLIQVGLLFYLLLAFNWYSERSRARMEEIVRQRKEMQGIEVGSTAAPETMEKFVCSECGADVPASAKNCPQCGESFDEDEEPKRGKAQFECSECGAAVDKGAMTCWNCGKEFEE